MAVLKTPKYREHLPVARGDLRGGQTLPALNGHNSLNDGPIWMI